MNIKDETPDAPNQKEATADPAEMRGPDAGKQIPIVGVGASAGGLAAFKDLFKSLPAETGMAFVLVQHLDPTHESLMVDLLSRHTKMSVIQVEDNMQVEPNHVYMIPPNWDLAIQNGALRLIKPHQRRGMRMPIDFFFNSVAEDQREKAICIILSGTGSDGTMGLKAVKSYGGMIMVQLPEEAQYDGMPSSAIATGVVDYILPVKEMPEILVRYIKHSYIRGHFGTEPIEISEPDDFNSILAIMHAQLGHNFHYYKKNTLIRRIKRRMGLKQLEQMHDYVLYLRNNPEETKELFKDCLIGVTGFFRENESWEMLDELVLNTLVEYKKSDQTLRIWVPGCSSGEEAYTIAILLNEKLESMNQRPDFNIFATDIDSNALEFARTGRYPESIASDLSESMLDKYFKKEDGFYQVSNRLRENIVFSAQNLISDPPFSKLDLITCRNLLIYLESNIQNKVIELFHFALSKGGHLMLGNSETIGQNEHLFKTVSKKWRIFERLETSVPTRGSFPILPDIRPWNRMMQLAAQDQTKAAIKPGEVMKEALVKKFAPTSVLITRTHEILYHFGDTTRYLHFPTGEHTDDLFSLVREGLATRIRGAVHKAVRSEKPVVISGAKMKRDGAYHRVGFSVLPLAEMKGSEGLFLVTFQDEAQKVSSHTEIEVSVEDETVVRQLEHELSSTRQELQNTIEELETSNEELKASNEEIMSMNEELQSSNEELETSKEELQSLNEELNTVNNELQDKVRSLEETNNDITNLVNSTNIAAIFLDTQFCIKFYTPSAKNLFNLIATDINRPLRHITAKVEDIELMAAAKDVLDTLMMSTAEVRNDEGQWYHRRIYPYRTQDGRIEGIVLTFENITELKQSKDDLARQNMRYEDAQHIAQLGNWELDLKTKHLYWSDEVYRIFEVDPSEFSVDYEASWEFVHPDDRERVKRAFMASVNERKRFNFKHRLLLKEGRIKYINAICSTEYGPEGEPLRAVGTVQDVTDQTLMEEKLKLSDLRYKELFSGIENGVAVYEPVDDGGDFVFSDINPAGEKIDRVAKKDVVGRPVTEVFPAVKEFGLFEVFQRVNSTGSSEHHPLSFYEDGRISGWRENYVYKLPSGEIVAAYADITTRKQYEERLKQSEYVKEIILNSVSEVITYMEPDRTIKWLNDAAVQAIGREREDVIGKNCHELWCSDRDECEQCPLTRALLSRKAEKGEVRDTNGRNWEIVTDPLLDMSGEVIGIVEVRKQIN